jgi:hypothetical protein
MYLGEQLADKNNEIEDLNKQIDVRDEQLFNLQVKLDKFTIREKENVTEYNKLKYAHDELKKTYDQLLNEIYEKIQNEEKMNSEGGKDKINKKTAINPENDTIRKLREKLVKHEDSKKIFEMNYEQLIIYTCNLEIANKQHEENKLHYEKRIKDLEKELQDVYSKYNESQKQIHMLKSENSRLQNKVNEVNRDLEMNMIYRPSKALNTRLSRVSKFDTKGSGKLAFQPSKAAKIFESENEVVKNNNNIANQAVVNNNETMLSEIRLSTLDEVDSSRNVNRLNNDNTFVFKNNDNFNLTASKFNFTPDMQEQSMTNNQSNIFGNRADESSFNDKYLFDGGKGKDDETFTNIDSFSAKPSMVDGKQVIMDYMEDNPFEKNVDEDDVAATDLNDSVNLKAYSKNSNLDVNIEEFQQRREKQKQKEINKLKKLNTKTPSLINEEEVEEDVEKEKISLKKDEKVSLGGAKGHNRMNTYEDLGQVMTKDSEYMCYDFLTLRKNMAIIKILEENWEDVSSYEMFSDNIYLIDDSNRKSKKYLFITSNLINLQFR